MPGLNDFLSATATPENTSPSPLKLVADPPPEMPLLKFLAGTDELSKLKMAVDEGQKLDTMKATRILKMQGQTGMPPDFIERNLDWVEEQTKAAHFDAAQFRKESPAVASWFAEHPAQFAAAQDDYHQLGYLEKLTNGLQQGMLSLQQEGAALQGYFAYSGLEDITRLRQTDKFARLLETSPDLRASYAARHKLQEQQLAGAIGSIAQRQGEIEQIPIDPVIQQALNATTFADFWHAFTQKPFEFIMTVGASSLPQSAPGYALGITGAIVGGPALGAAGMGIGSFAADFPATILQALQAEGINIHDAAAVHQAVQDKALMGRVGTQAFRHAVPVAVFDAFSMGIAGKVLGPTLKSKVATEAVNLAIQAPIQGALGAAGEAVGEVASGQPIQPGQIMAEFFGEFATAPVEVAGMAGARTKESYVTHMKAKQQEAIFTAMGTGVTDSKTFQRLPEAVQEMVRRATKDGPIENLYIPVESFKTFFQEKGMDPREAIQTLTGDVAAYDQAITTGQDVAIPTAVYATKIAPTPANAFFARELRTSVDGMNAREADDYAVHLAEQAKQEAVTQEATHAQEQQTGAAKVGQDITGQLLAAGFDPGVVQQYAQLFESRYRTRAERRGLGEDPMALFSALGLHIQNALPEILQKLGGQLRDEQHADAAAVAQHKAATAELTGLLDKLRAGDFPKPEHVYGQSLHDMLREAGGVQDQGGELSHMGIDEGRKAFQKKIIQPKGLTLERATERAVEGGYLPQHDIRAFLDLLTEEARGTPAYAIGKENQALAETQQQMEAIQQWLTQQGVDITKTPNDAVVKLMQQAGQPTPEGQTFAQTPMADPFYSKALVVLTAKMPNKAPAADVKKMLLANGVKPDEMKWTGLDDFLTGKETVTKQEVAEFLKEHNVQIKEVTLGGPKPTGMDALPKDWRLQQIDPLPEYGDNRFEVVDQNGNQRGSGPTEDEAIRTALINAPNQPEPKFSSYTLPGGTNYREVLLTLPHKDRYDVSELHYNETMSAVGTQWIIEAPGQIFQIPMNRYANVKDAIQYIADTKPRSDTAPPFTGGHFSEPNVLAHVRIDDRVDADGKKVLFVEEVQSDWHQKGKKYGYQGDPDESFMGNKSVSPPDAPFKKTWHELALKRLLRLAAEGGYDKLAWTTGAQQAERYDLSKQVKSISAFKNNDGTVNVLALDKNNGTIMDKNNVAMTELPDIIGKDLTDKIAAQTTPGYTYSGMDLKIGGEGMKGFYDQILPRFLNQYGKKWGAVVGSATIETAGSKPSGSVNTAKVHALPVTAAMKQSVLYEGQALFQSGGKDAKGSITFGNGRVDIAILEKADLSTFLHETGHLFLNELIQDATTPGVPQQVRDDLDTVLEHMKLTVRAADGTEAVTAAIQTPQHEQFARGFEAYAMEGKSPSQAMRAVFARFRQWLIQVYRMFTVKGGATPENAGTALNVNLTKAVREVMDRMIATDAEIDAAQAEAEVVPLFTDAAHAGMSEAEFTNYVKVVADARLAATEDLQTKMMAQLKREETAWWQAHRETKLAEVTAEVNAQKDYTALAILQQGAMPDGTPLPEGLTAVKLDKKALTSQFGKEMIARLPRGITASKAMAPDTAAQMFGYASGQELVTALMNARPKEALIQAETDLRMKHEFGDLRFDGTAAEQARAAVLNDHQDKVIEAEIKALRKKQREVSPFVKAAVAQGRSEATASLTGLPSQELVTRTARARIAGMPVRSLQPYAHFVAARKASREATAALAKQDLMKAIDEKQKELLNLALFREATAAKDETQRIYEHMVSLRAKPAQERLGKAGADYRDQVNELLDRYEFANVPLKEVRSRQSLAAWIAEKEANGETLGEEFSVPESVLADARRINYKELTFEELQGISDTVKQIEHFAALKNKLLKAQGQRDKETARAELIAAIEQNLKDKGPPPLTVSGQTIGDKASRLAQAFDASLIKMEQVVEWLDGGPTGPWHEHFWNPSADAQAAEYDHTKTITAKIAALVLDMPKTIRSRMLETVKITGIDNIVTRKDLLGVALNTGNQSNYDKLLKGMQWTDAQVQEMANHLTAEEWTFVQGVWDTLESMWPEIAALQKRLTGIEPERVKARPVQTPFGEIRGGYYPLMYDPILSEQGQLQLSSTFGKLLDGNYTKATLPSGYRKARVEGFARAFNLDIDQLPHHIAGVVKDLTHREWLIDANWIAHDPKIRAVLQRHLGDAGTLRMGEWVKQVANDRNNASMASLAIWQRAIEHLRFNTMIAAMGFKASTMLSQFAGIAPAVEVIGGKDLDGMKWFAKGVGTALTKPRSSYDFMVASSGEMRHRIQTRDRDMRDQLRLLQGKSDLRSQVKEASLMAIGYTELAVSMPSWFGGYYKGLDQGMSHEEAVRLGDRAVRLGQGAGGAKDLAAVAAKSDQLMRVLTMFYTPFSAMYARQRSIAHDTSGMRDVPQMAVRLFWTVAVAATLGAFASGQGPDKKKDETYLTWWAKNVAIYPFLGIPILRDAMNAIVQGYGYQFTPLSHAIEGPIKEIAKGEKAFSGDKEAGDLAESALKAFSFLVGLPTGQFIIIGKYLDDLYTGKAHPDNIFQFAHDMLYKRPKEN